MAGEVQITFAASKTVYFIVINRIGQFWNTNTGAFEAYNAANIANYVIGTSQVSANQTIYEGNFPPTIVAGVYSLLGKQQVGGSAAETDPNIGSEDFQWNGTATSPLSDIPVSGITGPTTFIRSYAIPNFEFYLRSAADHITPVTSGVVSGQISKDGGAFGVLQSGAFAEVGKGFYALQALTSGDLTCKTFGLIFTASSISGGLVSDPCVFTGVTAKISGSV